MTHIRRGYLTAAVIGALWTVVIATSVAITMSFATGDAFRPSVLQALVMGAALGMVLLRVPQRGFAMAAAVALFALTLGAGFGPMLTDGVGPVALGIAALLAGLGTGWSLHVMFAEIRPGTLTRHEFEDAVIRFLTGFGYIFFTAIVAIPFYVMVMTSLKNQQQLVANPLDFSLDLTQGWGLFRSYYELFASYNFGTYMVNSLFISVMTVAITLLFSVPGAYAVARLRFKGQAVFSRSILLIYMVPIIVLALPIYIGFSMTGLRNTIFGILLIYPVTTIPVALYMLQGYFRGLPQEVEEAGLMDGLNRLQVIWKITLPLALPALASVSLYVFMIAWNEFLLAFMLLDDPSKFTLTRGIASLNSSEIPRQHLMAGAVVATVPIMALFLGLERFMTKGLTAGSVKG
ncbi:Inner membrane ABC transporter permease protein YcjP [Roseibaca ekhonensis]|uniref:Inner membrane ABC transporter permease protein YcjP n=1 Tax=Roseinatronobacter ekhonensis TaxID=254356 RepID=A0A3B0MT48_9RHOB|nr:carbohydrate ABC transporter permease [Roseibaca ekhonensis]SUZ32014.1 Inner membrane ABC transporter permease protein YcjP [Roseibaca ekhonensis]